MAMNNEPKKTILVIEDDLDVLSILVKHVKLMGYEVITATDGLEGLKRLDEGGYDLVITDIVMPFVSGVGVVTAIKRINTKIPIIAVTGYGKEPEALAMERKADMVLAKPVKMTILKEHIAQLLESGEEDDANVLTPEDQ
ncbi:MAG: response regulator [Deltaproteobacteria bacterium]|nr:response regulator [Deltaproteobacteria bacterium]